MYSGPWIMAFADAAYRHKGIACDGACENSQLDIV